MAHHETIETKLPAGCRLATAEDEDGFTCFDWTVVLQGDLATTRVTTVRVTDAPDPLEEAMAGFFASGPTSSDVEQRTAGALGLVRAGR